MKVAFYSPIKPPDHPVPSGDRTMANHLIAALRAGGHSVRLASRLRSYCSRPDFDAAEAAARVEIERLLAERDRADVWFTYHPYYKAPDLIGPSVAEQLNIPYVTAEASYSSRRQTGEWACAQSQVVKAVRQAAVNLCITPIDREGLGAIVGEASLADLPAFVDTSQFDLVNPRQALPHGCRLVTVAMMRPGVKSESYEMLAAALRMLDTQDWSLTVIGDGSARETIANMFDGIGGGRIKLLGELADSEVYEQLMRSDVFVWPGFGEAYGLAYLEAQACGLPVVAQDTGGISSVVRDGETGLLTQLGDVPAFAEAIGKLASDTGLRADMSDAARRFVHDERNLTVASNILSRELQRIAVPAGGETVAT